MQLPSDAQIIMATLKLRRREQTTVPYPPSTYAQDVASITSHTGAPSLYPLLGSKHCRPAWLVILQASGLSSDRGVVGWTLSRNIASLGSVNQGIQVCSFCVFAGYSSSCGSSGSEFSGFMMSGRDKEACEVEGSEGSASASGSRRMWGSRVAKFLSSCSGNLGSSGTPP